MFEDISKLKVVFFGGLVFCASIWLFVTFEASDSVTVWWTLIFTGISMFLYSSHLDNKLKPMLIKSKKYFLFLCVWAFLGIVFSSIINSPDGLSELLASFFASILIAHVWSNFKKHSEK